MNVRNIFKLLIFVIVGCSCVAVADETRIDRMMHKDVYQKIYKTYPRFKSKEEFLASVSPVRQRIYNEGFISFTPVDSKGWEMWVCNGKVFWQNNQGVYRAGIR